MSRISRPILTLVLLIFTFNLLFPSPVAAVEWINNDNGISRVNSDKIPQLNVHGQIQDEYNQDSFFPLIMYFTDLGEYGQPWNVFNLNSRTSRDTLPELQEAGYNASYLSWFVPSKKELNHAADYDIKVIANVSNPAKKIFENPNDPTYVDNFKTTIARLRDNPQVIAYHLFDEKPGYPASSWTRIKNIIRSVDPDKIVFANKYETGCFPYNDITNFDHYPFGDGYANNLLSTGIAIKESLNLGCPRPVFVIVQAFREQQWGWRRPSNAELRGQIYAAIANGATGIYTFLQHTPWAWNQKNAPNAEGYLEDKEHMGGISPQVTPGLWSAMSRTNHEITQYKYVFLSKTSKDPYHQYRTTGVFNSVLKDPGEPNIRYLLVVNTYGRDNSIKLIFPKAIVQVDSLFLPNQTVNLSGDHLFFTADFPGYGVNLYRLTFDGPTPSPSPSISASASPSLAPSPSASAYNPDLNDDHIVNFDDWDILQAVFGQTGDPGWIKADINNNGAVDIRDYNLVLTYFGQTR